MRRSSGQEARRCEAIRPPLASRCTLDSQGRCDFDDLVLLAAYQFSTTALK